VVADSEEDRMMAAFDIRPHPQLDREAIRYRVGPWALDFGGLRPDSDAPKRRRTSPRGTARHVAHRPRSGWVRPAEEAGRKPVGGGPGGARAPGGSRVPELVLPLPPLLSQPAPA
jgi:hypothetical protein